MVVTHIPHLKNRENNNYALGSRISECSKIINLTSLALGYSRSSLKLLKSLKNKFAIKIDVVHSSATLPAFLDSNVAAQILPENMA
jgi:hypothetical protein